ncbi:CopD family protein [Turneriella parva]|uniref:Copper resistance protein D domain-containing protein n=1 Tax=Turneriella parva (strain ATCC BAA-1111 / DSM 21527 / NCTC 11395 / H) TaxID=869212 RepID=I4B632_TURPD|nr:CopD family protein [Turneriella parva]AFM12739.1 hypothetical protein Turpa_2093 [Turneriella parva DSM 21527]
MNYPFVLAVHLLCATIWTGGHIVLFSAVLLPALKSRDHTRITDFEKYFERVGVPALLLLILTGIWLAYQQVPDISLWFSLNSAGSRTIATKLVLLALTLGLALHARLRIIPGLTAASLGNLAIHITLVTVISILFALTGLLHRFGGIWR